MSKSLWHRFVEKASRALRWRLRARAASHHSARRRFLSLLSRDRGLERLEDRSLMAGLNLIISGNQVLTYNGDVEIASIVGDAVAGGDNVTIQATGQVRFTGNVGGGGLHNVTVVGREIDVDPNVVVSTRSIGGGADPKTAASTGDSGDLNFS